MDFYVNREEQEQAEEAQRKREAEARAAQERHRREEESRQQAAQQPTEELRSGQGTRQAQPSRQGSKRLVLLAVGGIALFVVLGTTVGLAAVLLREHYSPTTLSASKPTPSLPKAESHPAPGPQNSSSNHQKQVSETALRQAIEDYYKAVARRDWGYTYSHLDSETQSAFTRDEWFAKNEWLADTSPVTYTIQSVDMDSSSPESVANVAVLLTAADGSTSTRNTYFVYEDGAWIHRFGAQEYELFANAQSGSASANSTSSSMSNSSASATPTASDAKSSSSSGGSCKGADLYTRAWEGWVAPSEAYGKKPCMSADGTSRFYVPTAQAVPMVKYLAAANAGDYDAMYSLLSQADRDYYTLNEWRRANTALGTDQTSYKWVDTRITLDPEISNVGSFQAEVEITLPSGETVTQYRWWMGNESGPTREGIWLNRDQIDILNKAIGKSDY